MIVDGLREVLACAEVALGGQHRGMAEQELDLLEFAAGGAAELGAGAPGVVRGELRLADFGAVAPDHLPDGVFADPAREHLAALVHGTKDRTGLDLRALEPGIEQQLDPGRHGHGPQALAFARQVRNRPACIAQLNVADIERDQLGAPQPATEQEAEQRPVAAPDRRATLRRVEQRRGFGWRAIPYASRGVPARGRTLTTPLGARLLPNTGRNPDI
jgi:hypothetical protein